MLKKIAQIVNLILWILILIAFVFNDYFGASVNCSDNKSFGPIHLMAILFGVVGVIAAIVGMLEKKEE